MCTCMYLCTYLCVYVLYIYINIQIYVHVSVNVMSTICPSTSKSQYMSWLNTSLTFRQQHLKIPRNVVSSWRAAGRLHH